jgi:Arm DNA-binding domain
MVGRRVLSKLTVKTVANLKRPGRHSDGNGLYLIVTNAGTKSYAFLYRREGRSHEMGLGSVITTSLADARQKAGQCRSLLAQGIDPLETWSSFNNKPLCPDKTFGFQRSGPKRQSASWGERR